MKIVITGSEGFIGQHLVKALILLGHNIVGMDIRVNVNQDIRDLFFVQKTFKKEKPDIVIHLAARATVELGIADPIETYMTNIIGTANILEASRRNNIKLVIVASSDKEYGDSTTEGYTEEQSIKGICPYSTSKACADLIARSYWKIWKLATVVVRCSNIYGPGDSTLSRIVPRTIDCILHDKPAILQGRGLFVRDFLYIDDLVEGYLRILRKPFHLLGGRTYNFGTGKGTSCKEIIHMLYTISQKKLRVRYVPEIPATIFRQINNPDLAHRNLRWVPKTDLFTGLQKTYKWYREHP